MIVNIENASTQYSHPHSFESNTSYTITSNTALRDNDGNKANQRYSASVYNEQKCVIHHAKALSICSTKPNYGFVVFK